MGNAARQFEIETQRGARIMRTINDQHEAQIRADAAQEAAERRDRARNRADACRRHQERYADSFDAFGAQTPPPIDGEFPGDYRRRLLQRLIDKLPNGARWSGTQADDFGRDMIGPIEQEVLSAATAEGERPSPENLPDDGTLIARHRVDSATGQRFTEYFGKRSFIADMNRPGKRLVAIHTPTGSVLFGNALRPGVSVEGQRLGNGLWR